MLASLERLAADAAVWSLSKTRLCSEPAPASVLFSLRPDVYPRSLYCTGGLKFS
jgi:hypothetical protein